MKNINDPINAPIIAKLHDIVTYKILLSRALNDAMYLNGIPDAKNANFYNEGMWHPWMSKVRYGLLWISLKHPESESYYDQFCEIYLKCGNDCQLSDFKGKQGLVNAIEIIQKHLKDLE